MFKKSMKDSFGSRKKFEPMQLSFVKPKRKKRRC